MAFLNDADRDRLLNELSSMNFKRAKARLRRMDPKGKIAVYRNVQNTGEWITRYDLHGLGTKVTLVEAYTGYEGDPAQRKAADYKLVQVIVEPMPGNRT